MTKEKLKYVIVLVNYNNWSDTVECVRSLGQGGVGDDSILIIENGSTDNSFDKLSECLSSVKVLHNDHNLGFSGANNIGIRYAADRSAEYVILLNNDTLVEQNAIVTLLRQMDHHTNASIGTGLITYYPEKKKIWYAGGKLVGWRGLAVHRYRDESVDVGSAKKEPEFVTFASGCYLCLRVADLPRLGFLDERFFLYLEDIEYSARAVKNGLRLLYVPSSVIYHKCRGERLLKAQTLYYAVRNRNLLIDTSFPLIAKCYFYFVIRLKMTVWYFTDRMLYEASRKGLRDFKKNIVGQYQ
ncbi:MAG TPA: glycosyltransferase family 2 protein [Bacteroidota bacterium]|nr:glycosyltransferase family 2 protein [Bacteroidota bacterium]